MADMRAQLYHEEHGGGQPLLLLHGFGGCTRNWAPFIAGLAPHYRLIVVDLPGHGRSPDADGGFTHRDAAAQVFRLLDLLGIQHCCAMGLSSGAMTLLHMATSQPARIGAMVLVSATTHFPEQARIIMRRAALDTMPPPVRQMYRDCAACGDAQVARLIAQFNALGDNHDDMNFSAQDLSAVTARTLLIHGERDRFFPTWIAAGLRQAIPHAELWIIPGGEHVPVLDPGVPFTHTALAYLQGQ